MCLRGFWKCSVLICKIMWKQIGCSIDLKLKGICKCYHIDFLAEFDLSRYIGINYITFFVFFWEIKKLQLGLVEIESLLFYMTLTSSLQTLRRYWIQQLKRCLESFRICTSLSSHSLHCSFSLHSVSLKTSFMCLQDLCRN